MAFIVEIPQKKLYRLYSQPSVPYILWICSRNPKSISLLQPLKLNRTNQRENSKSFKPQMVATTSNGHNYQQWSQLPVIVTTNEDIPERKREAESSDWD